jgi:hypothetical protein
MNLRGEQINKFIFAALWHRFIYEKSKNPIHLFVLSEHELVQHLTGTISDESKMEMSGVCTDDREAVHGDESGGPGWMGRGRKRGDRRACALSDTKSAGFEGGGEGWLQGGVCVEG